MTLVATRALTARSELGRGVLLATEFLTGGAAVVSGVVLVIRPDGALLGLPTMLLAGTPFTDWRVPGTLLAGSVGIGFLASAALTLCEHRWSTAISVLAGAGLVLFEVVEWGWIGFHPLQPVFLLVGTAVSALALTDGRRRAAAAAGDDEHRTAPSGKQP